MSIRFITRRVVGAANVGLATAAFLTSACSADRTLAPDAPAAAPLVAATTSADEIDLSAAAANVGPIVSATGTGCLTGQTGAAALRVTPCAAGTATQTWTVPAVGTPGALSVHSAAMCGYAGGLNYWGMTMKCVNGDPAEQWTPTAAGELRSPAGYCLAAVASAGGTSVQLQLCNGSTAQQWTVPAPPTAPTGGSATVGQLASATGAGCLYGKRASAGVSVVPCVGGAAEQTWTVPAVGTSGLVSAHLDIYCVSDANVSWWALTVTCQTGGPALQWTPTAAGELKSPAGYCLAAVASGGGTAVQLQACNGTASQRWTFPTTPVPPAAPVDTSPLPTGTAAVAFLMGSTPTAASVEARGGSWATYERNFRTWIETRWAVDGTAWAIGNMYDRVMILYEWWARTGNTAYRDRAAAMALDYRNKYVIPNNYAPAAHYSDMDGLALHYLVTRDPASLTAVGRVADQFVSYTPTLGDTLNDNNDNRTQARVLVSLLVAHKLRAPSTHGYKWDQQIKYTVDRILKSQSPDGAYRFSAQCGQDKAWMDGMLNDALIRYDEMFPDPRILPTVRRSVDWMYAKMWRPLDGAFQSISAQCTRPWGTEGVYPAPEANMMVADAFAWVGKKTGVASYFSAGDLIFAQGVARSWYGGDKTFNEVYTSSYRYLQYRW